MTTISLMKKELPYINITFDSFETGDTTKYYNMDSRLDEDTILAPEEIEDLIWKLENDSKIKHNFHIALHYGSYHIWNLEHIQVLRNQMQGYLHNIDNIELSDKIIDNWDLDLESIDEVKLNKEIFSLWLTQFISLCNKALLEKRNMMLMGD